MTASRDILLILGVPPPYGGGEIRASMVDKYFCGSAGYRIFRYSREMGSKSTQGRVTIRNLSFGLYYILRCFAEILSHRPRVVFLSIPKDFRSFARSIPIIALASILGIRIFGELAGARFTFLDGGWRKYVGLFFLRRIYSIRFLGQHIREGHLEYRLPRPVVFSNGIELPRPRLYSCLTDGQRIQLLAVGALNRSKGTGRIIEAIAMCRRRGVEVSCDFVGEWSNVRFREEMVEFVAKNSLSSCVHFYGLIKGDAKWDYYRRAHILVHPTDWDGQPLTILEAMGMGLAVISTNVGAIPDTISHGVNGILLQENSPEQLSDAICELHRDRQKLQSIMGRNIMDFDRRFDASIYLKNLRNWIEAE